MNYFIAEKIKEIRKMNNLSQDRFGMKIGISGKSISAYETGKIKPPLKVLEKISKTYNASMFLVQDEEDLNLEQTVRYLQNNMEYLLDILRQKLSL